jgi:hypothetical protein
MGRATLSAAGKFVTEVERSTDGTLVGEDLGTSPNQYGDSVPVTLEHTGLVFRVAPQCIMKGDPADPRITIEPTSRYRSARPTTSGTTIRPWPRSWEPAEDDHYPGRVSPAWRNGSALDL